MQIEKKTIHFGPKNNWFVEHGRIRTCNLLIRSQTRYPLRHAPTLSM